MVLEKPESPVCPSGASISVMVGFITELFHWDTWEKTSVLIPFLIKQRPVCKNKSINYIFSAYLLDWSNAS